MSEPDAVPGNFYMFKFLIDLTHRGATYTGTPRQAARVGDTVRWVVSLEYLLPDPSIPHAPWIDDPERGFRDRILTGPEDVLGCQGMLGGHVFVFEKILDTGKSAVTFSLYNIREGWRLAYSFENKLYNPVALTR